MENACIYNENVKDAYSENSVCGSELSGKTVLITGGYGGVGIAAAYRFLQEGCKVYIAGRNQYKLKSAVAYLKRKKKDSEIEGILLDIDSADSISDVVEDIEKKQIQINILVHCIGWGADADVKGEFLNIEEKYFERVYDTNYSGIVTFTESIYEKMHLWEGEKQIVIVGSVAAVFRKYQFTPYGIAKTALREYAHYLAKRDKDISAVIVEPGGIATALIGSGVGCDLVSDGNVLHRRMLPEEIAAFIAFSCLPEMGKRLNGQAVELSACEAISANKKIASCPLELDIKRYGARLNSYAGNSLEDETIEIKTNLDEISVDRIKSELKKEGCHPVMEPHGAGHALYFLHCDELEIVKQTYFALQRECLRCIDQGVKGIFSVCVMASDGGEKQEIAAKSLGKMLEGLGEKMAQHGIYVNGAVAAAGVPLLDVIHCGIYLNSKYGRILTGEVLYLV